jgi:membrane-associated phospholipid phosphatase
MPVLAALIFWEYAAWRTAFLAFSVVFAVVVLLGHIHYSIDVASAYFITFTIFVIAKTIFAKDWAMFNNPIAK